jgi:hypothetical protein
MSPADDTIFEVNMSRRIAWAGYLIRMEEIRSGCDIFVGKSQEKMLLGVVSVGGSRVGGGLDYLHRSPMSRKSEPGARGYNWATLSLGNMNTNTWSSRLGVGHKTDDLYM